MNIHLHSYSQAEIRNKPTAITEEVLKSKSRTNLKQKGIHNILYSTHSIMFELHQANITWCMTCTINCLAKFPLPVVCIYVYAAAQMWTLARNLPVMIGDLIPEGDTYWETFLTLLDILDICMAQVVSDDMAAHLNLLIRHHHEAYRDIYPETPLLPKQHYMVHYPDWMKK